MTMASNIVHRAIINEGYGVWHTCNSEVCARVYRITHQNGSNLSAFEYVKNIWRPLKSRRLDQPYMNHIMEGMAILDLFGVDANVMRAFMLHPFAQDDQALQKFYQDVEFFKMIPPKVLILMMEYRSVVNQYLTVHVLPDPNREFGSPKITLSPLTEVNLMLAADKMQNYWAVFNDPKNQFALGKDKWTLLKTYFRHWFVPMQLGPDDVIDLLKELRMTFAS